MNDCEPIRRKEKKKDSVDDFELVFQKIREILVVNKLEGECPAKTAKLAAASPQTGVKIEELWPF